MRKAEVRIAGDEPINFVSAVLSCICSIFSSTRLSCTSAPAKLAAARLLGPASGAMTITEAATSDTKREGQVILVASECPRRRVVGCSAKGRQYWKCLEQP